MIRRILAWLHRTNPHTITKTRIGPYAYWTDQYGRVYREKAE